MALSHRVLYPIALLTLALTACEALKSSKPIFPIKEYEKMLVGSFDADYVGTSNCLAACHFHDRIRRDFEASTMGAQLAESSGLPLVNCETCHGPGSLAIQNVTLEKVAADKADGKQTECNYRTLIDIKNLPAHAKSLICLKCHTANATFNLHNWNISEHAVNDVSCVECHDVHVGPDLKVKPREVGSMCFQCHQEIQAEFFLPSHHPLQENRIFCTDCHDAHGTGNEKSLREDTIKATCTRCHAEKEGPFLYEHAENTEDCRTCHRPHGSVNNNLLTVQMPFLCLQCHSGHTTSTTSTLESKGAFFTRCTDCHSQIHGTDIPSASGKGHFTQ